MPTAGKNLLVSDKVMAWLSARAASEGRTVDELAEERLLESLRKEQRDKSWQGLLARGRKHGQTSGVTEEQVPEVVREYRAEHRGR